VFTGIVVEVGVVRAPAPQLEVRAPRLAAGAAVGDSICVEGCCLTVTRVTGGLLSFDAIPETLRLTTLGALAAGDSVNLEPALAVGDRMAGHWVQGHVDGVGEVAAVDADGAEVVVTVTAPSAVLRTTVLKGSICVAGVSLTVTGLDDESFSVALIPHTRAATTLGALVPGRRVNLEADVLGRYVERLLTGTLRA
jgi:riboflavin synthase